MGAFLDEIQNFTVAEIVAALGCPRGTAYYWKMGKRCPPAWMEPIFLRVLKEAFPAKKQRRARKAKEG
jgi:hypothetical protein